MNKHQPSRNDNIKTVTFDRSAAALVLKALKRHNCASCSVELTPDNFAGAVHKKLYCSLLPCLMVMSDQIKETQP